MGGRVVCFGTSCSVLPQEKQSIRNQVGETVSASTYIAIVKYFRVISVCMRLSIQL